MPWQSFAVDQYESYLVALNTSGFPDIYGFIRLYWTARPAATLWFHRDTAPAIAPNGSFVSGGLTTYYARFKQAEFAAAVDLLRNEKPIFFQFNDTTNGAFLATSPEPVGEAEQP